MARRNPRYIVEQNKRSGPNKFIAATRRAGGQGGGSSSYSATGPTRAAAMSRLRRGLGMSGG